MSSRTTVCLAEMVWSAVESALENGIRTAIVAVDSIEQRGPHLPLNMDTLDGDDLSHRIATELGDALAVPTPSSGPSTSSADLKAISPPLACSVTGLNQLPKTEPWVTQHQQRPRQAT